MKKFSLCKLYTVYDLIDSLLQCLYCENQLTLVKMPKFSGPNDAGPSALL